MRLLLRVLIGALLASVVMLVWGGVWNNALPFARNTIRPMKSHAAFVTAIKAQRLLPGVYQWPYDPGPDADEAARAEYIAEHEGGPTGMLFVAPGRTPMGGDTLLAGFVHIFLVALLLAGALAMALPALPGYGMRVLFCAVVMTVGAAFVNLGYPIWFPMTWPYWAAAFFFDVVSGLLAGLVLAKALGPSPSPSRDAA